MIVVSSALKPVRRSRWRFGYSLRTLLVLITGLCVSLGLAYSSAKRQERAVAAINKFGGSVGYDWQYERTTGQPLRNPIPPGPLWLRKLLGPHYFDTAICVSLSLSRLHHRSAENFSEVGPFLRMLPGLRQLYVSYAELDDDEFAIIGQLEGLEYLSLAELEITDNGAVQLAALKNLRACNLGDIVISGKGIAELKNLPKLEKLSLCCKHWDYGPHNAPIWNAERYALRDDALVAFPEFPRLRLLDLSFTQVTDDGMAIFSRMPQLECLEVGSPKITNVSIEHVVKLKNLTWLGLEDCQIDEQGIERLHELPRLTRLRVSGPNLANDSLKECAKLHKLERLMLGGKNINDEGLQHLHGMQNLRYLDLQSTKVKTDSPEVAELKKALPNCSVHQYYPNPSFR